MQGHFLCGYFCNKISWINILIFFWSAPDQGELIY